MSGVRLRRQLNVRRLPQNERHRLSLLQRDVRKDTRALMSLLLEVKQLKLDLRFHHVLERRFRHEPQVEVELRLGRGEDRTVVWAAR